ncbi:ASCH domain-containing protein [Treponema sp. R6D11]
MNNSNDDTVVLMSINPQYVKAIQSGNKLIEFRKRKFTKTVKNILVYETAPLMAVVGYFEIKYIDIGTPKEIWKKYSKIGEITEVEYFKYYTESNIAVGISINEYFPFSKPIDLRKYKIKPPQSFIYLTKDLFKNMKKIGS